MRKTIAIFGAGQSGQAARRLAHSLGDAAVLFDEGGQGDAQTFTATDLPRFDAFVFSPGFAADHPWRCLVVEAGRICLSELAYAGAHWRGRLIGVTGTNGKTTLTKLLANALAAAGHPSVAAGNIGYPLSDAVLSAANEPAAFGVVEISSFQAELCQQLELNSLLWTNFAEDHLDRYGSMEAYFKAKARLISCLGPDGRCVCGPEVVPWLQRFGRAYGPCEPAVGDPGQLEPLAADSVFRRHPYMDNFRLAAAWWKRTRWPLAPLIRAADGFELDAHRLSLVAERAGTRFWDDSKATNFHAALAAIASLGSPIVWIGGGRAKGGDLDSFARAVAAGVDVAVVYGEVAERLADAMHGQPVSVVRHDRLADAVEAAAALADGMESANVLFSPGFASFDQFESYGARGKMFRNLVLGLKNARPPR